MPLLNILSGATTTATSTIVSSGILYAEQPTLSPSVYVWIVVISVVLFIIALISINYGSLFVKVGGAFAFLAGMLLLLTLISESIFNQSAATLIFSPTQLLEATWMNYKNLYVEPVTFRTLDRQRNNITTSEGQSYTMLRAVWMSDKPTFDGVWLWTQQHLQHTNDHLFSWLWGQRPDGSYGVLTAQNGQNTASDADEDIALSLVFAYARWQDPHYLDAARGVISDIWKHEVVTVGGVPYLAADNLENNPTAPSATINPSYLHPAAYRIFALVDTTHPWNALVNSSYSILQRSMTASLAESSAITLPPDWLQVNKATGVMTTASATGTDTQYGFDAIRVPYRLALDEQWFNDPRDAALLRDFSFLATQWHLHHTLAAIYTHSGTVADPSESAAMYGTIVGAFQVMSSSDADAIYRDKLLYLYNPGANAWKRPLTYYDDNWAWFGIALYNHLLPNLTANIPAQAFGL